MLTHRFDDALSFAAATHLVQTRKCSNVPYISHLMAVCALTLEYGGDEDCAIAALLHDAVEDQGGELMATQIKARFGARVHDIVLECSDTTELPKPPWFERKKAYVAGIATKSDDALLVTTCDKVHNVSTILYDLHSVGLKVFERFSASRPEVIWYYRALADRIHARRPDALSERLLDTVDRLETEVAILAQS